jgi:hypothetical protein
MLIDRIVFPTCFANFIMAGIRIRRILPREALPAHIQLLSKEAVKKCFQCLITVLFEVVRLSPTVPCPPLQLLWERLNERNCLCQQNHAKGVKKHISKNIYVDHDVEKRLNE